ncbi:hypothetical protein ASD83_05225 [Devosia sp. Root685]|uniref:TniQ family protein n=1 Tax=Devosia sp. Root685 TaxID=1736587 RepID=UPI0006FC7399|nr:TniQ family protein [Devosia sp. Root685]KRA99890.1 hypothetical protein ASD83_05225 [Devosia sp. Root685]
MTNFYNVAPLSDCLPLCPRETALSYVSRLAPYFGCQSTYQFCKDFDLDLSKLMDGDHDALMHLSRLTNADFGELQRWSAITLPSGRKSINGQVLTHSRSSRRTMAFCPLCASEDIATNPKVTADLAVYVRAEWQASDIRHCGAHRVPLLRYVVDNRRSRTDLGNFIGQFMADYEGAATAESNVGDLETYSLSRLIGTDQSPIPHLDDLDLWQVVSLSRSMGAAMVNEVRQFKLLDLRRLDELGAIGFAALYGGIETIEVAFQGIRSNHWKDREVGALKRVERFFKNSVRTEAIARISGLIAEAAFATFPYKLGERFCGVTCETVSVQPSGVARESLGIPKSIWHAFVSAKPAWVVHEGGHSRHTLVELEAARAFFRNYILVDSLPDLARQHDLSRQHLQHLKLGGAIAPTAFANLPNVVELYSRSEVEEAIVRAQRFQTIAANDNEIPVGYLNLLQVSKVHAIGIQQLLDEIHAGTIHCVRTEGGSNANLTTWIDPVEAMKKIFGFDTPMTLQGASDFIGLHINHVRILAQHGILPSRSRPRGNGIFLTFERADVEAFVTKYVTTGEVTRRKLKIPTSVSAVEIRHPSWNTAPVRLYERANLAAA